MRIRVGAAAVSVTAALVLTVVGIGPASADEHPYTGTEYDRGGTTTSVDGPVPAVDALADDITATTDAAMRDLAAVRGTLRYGQLDEAPPGGPQQLVTYPAPAGIAPSDQYTASVRQGDRVADSFVYRVAARKTDTNREQDTSWTSFSFAEPVEVSVHKLAGSATGCLVRPASAGIVTRFAGGTCTFTLVRPANLSVEFVPDTTNPVAHPMLVFANPPETDVPPATGDPDVLYFGPGVHHIGSGIALHSGETVYLAGGAWVEGAFKGVGVSDVVIKGRGVIDGTFLDTGDQTANKKQPGLIDITNSRNVLIEGITLVDGPRFNVRAIGSYDTIRNVKVMSWWFSTDGVVAGNPGLVEDNFIKVNDDSIKLFWGDTVARHNTIWQLENGAPFMMSWNIEQDSRDFHVYDNDVIHAEHNQFSPQAVFRARHAGAGHLQRYLFENIRVEDADWRLFYLILENNKWYDPSLGFGQISDVVFRNITADTPFRLPSVVQGIDADHGIADVSFVNVTMNGACLSDATGFQLDPATTDRIRIMKDAACHS
ncbi:MAG TPA: hypothetical protein VF054_08505 [Micromonosporaceae bacterium]